MDARGRFITFEGGEGAGKSTQAARLVARLRAAEVPVHLTREPGGSALGERLRSALTGAAGARLSAAQQAMLFAAARADHVDTLIAPSLDGGTWVVCDRFADSTEAYQGPAGAPAPLLAALRHVAVGACEPDLTIVIDVAPDVGLSRARRRDTLDRFEREEAAIQAARRDAFLQIAAREPDRCIVLDGTADEEDTAEAVWAAVAGRLPVPRNAA